MLTSGGVSVGDADYTRALMARLGDVAFWKVAMRPGRPFAFGPLHGAQGRDFVRGADEASQAGFGGELAATHAAGADAFGAAPAGWWPDHTGGFIADLPLPLGAWDAFGPFYADARIEPYLRLLGPLGGLVGGVRRAGVFDDLMAALRDPASGIAGPPCAPARLHGDLWSGNVVFGRRADGEPVRGWLIDPAAHGGHPETDLAMLALFGMPRLNDILAGYADSAPLAEGWRARVPLHQVHPLLVHAVLFGGGYLDQAVDAARAALRTAA